MIGPQTPDPLPRSLNPITDRLPVIEDLLAIRYIEAPWGEVLAWCVAEVRALRQALSRASHERDYYIGRLQQLRTMTLTSLGPDFARRLREGEAAAAEHMASRLAAAQQTVVRLDLGPRAGQEGEADTQS